MDLDDRNAMEGRSHYEVQFRLFNVKWRIEVEADWPDGLTEAPKIYGVGVMHADWDRPDGSWDPLAPIEVRALMRSDSQAALRASTITAIWESECSRRN